LENVESGKPESGSELGSQAVHRPFAELKALLKEKK
jgi:hypothetical protein